MKLKPIVVGVAVMLAASFASAAELVTTEYKLSYDETTTGFGSLSSWFSSGSSFGFTWGIKNAVQVYSTDGSLQIATFALPSFTLTANTGYSLSGAVTAFFGNLAFTEIGGATTGILAYADVSLDGGTPQSVSGLVGWTDLLSGPGFMQGIFADTATLPVGGFTSLTISNASIVLSATGGSFSSIYADSQSKLEFSFTATPVPEPETYAMLLSGIAVIGWVARRRRQA